eukprot:5522099-Prymnesium_polylepis.2
MISRRHAWLCRRSASTEEIGREWPLHYEWYTVGISSNGRPYSSWTKRGTCQLSLRRTGPANPCPQGRPPVRSERAGTPAGCHGCGNCVSPRGGGYRRVPP